jgi:hypothetical protein
MSPGITLYAVNAVIILSVEDGSRLYAKYYTAPHAGGGQNAGMSRRLSRLVVERHCSAMNDDMSSYFQ